MSGFITGSGFIGAPGFICGGSNPIIPHIGEITVFSYDGTIKTYTVPYTGWYKLVAKGAQGGGSHGIPGGTTNASITTPGANGNRAIGYKYLLKGTVLYICPGGRGNLGGSSGTSQYVLIDGGFNGGGKGRHSKSSGSDGGGSGGGATHIALATGILSSVSPANVLLIGGGAGGNHFRLVNGPTYWTTGIGEGTVGSYAYGLGQNADLDTICAGGGGGFSGGNGGVAGYETGGNGGSCNIDNVSDYNQSSTKSISIGVQSGDGEASIEIFAP